MSQRRIDRIAKIIEKAGGRAKISVIRDALREQENNLEIGYSAIHVAVQSENNRLEELGERRRYRTHRDGEQRGWLSVEPMSQFTAGSIAQRIEDQIREANSKVDGELRAYLKSMNWRTFESTFLSEVLTKLGFEGVEITQPTRDGGADARVTYKRGLVEARAIVSAKRWSAASVPVDEVQRLRGLKGEEDTAIIITTSRFTEDAKREARPGQNQRVVYLIDGDTLVRICREHQIGVKRIELPYLFVTDSSQFEPAGAEEEDDDEVNAEEASSDEQGGEEDEDEDGDRDGTEDGDNKKPRGLLRFRDEMLGDQDRGLTYSEISTLLGLSQATVRNYLYDEDKRRMLGDRIRADDAIRARAIAIVNRRRAG